jgi:hypothetical protein
MKVTDSPSASPSARSAPAKSFAQVLKPAASPKAAKPDPKRAQARPSQPAAKPTPKATPTGRPPLAGRAPATVAQAKAARALRDVRTSAAQAGHQHAAARRAEKRLSKAHANSAQVQKEHHDERKDDRFRVALFQELERDERKDSQSPAASQPVALVAAGPTSAAPSPTPGSGERAQAIAALVERIEVALRTGVPTMSLALSDQSCATSVEIARTGKGEVAVRLGARAGKRDALAGAAESIRGALEARGLRVRSLKIG